MLILALSRLRFLLSAALLVIFTFLCYFFLLLPWRSLCFRSFMLLVTHVLRADGLLVFPFSYAAVSFFFACCLIWLLYLILGARTIVVYRVCVCRVHTVFRASVVLTDTDSFSCQFAVAYDN